MSKIPNFWQFFNLTSQPVIPSLYWDSYSYEERIKKICDKIFAILNYLKLVMELLNEFDDRLEVLEELYNAIDARITELESVIDSVNALFDIIADEYDETATYAKYSYVIHNEKLYKCNTAINTPGPWDPSKWTQVQIGTQLQTIFTMLDTIGSAMYDLVADEYDVTATYPKYSFVVHNEKLYKCNTAINTPGAWDPSKWTQVQVGTQLRTIFNMLDNISNEMSDIISTCLSVIGPTYNSTSTYDVGDYSIHNNKLYKCTTAVTTAEPFDQNKWTEVNVASELEHIYDIIGSILPDDGMSLKFANVTSSAAKTIGAYFPLIFTSQQRRNVSGQSDTTPYIVDAAGIQLAGISEVLASGRYDHPEDITVPSIIYNDNNTSITVNSRSYTVMCYICNGTGQALAVVKSGGNIIYIFGHNSTSWDNKVINYVESADEATALSSSINNPHAIFYVAE